MQDIEVQTGQAWINERGEFTNSKQGFARTAKLKQKYQQTHWQEDNFNGSDWMIVRCHLRTNSAATQ